MRNGRLWLVCCMFHRFAGWIFNQPPPPPSLLNAIYSHQSTITALSTYILQFRGLFPCPEDEQAAPNTEQRWMAAKDILIKFKFPASHFNNRKPPHARPSSSFSSSAVSSGLNTTERVLIPKLPKSLPASFPLLRTDRHSSSSVHPPEEEWINWERSCSFLWSGNVALIISLCSVCLFQTGRQIHRKTTRPEQCLNYNQCWPISYLDSLPPMTAAAVAADVVLCWIPNDLILNVNSCP